MSIAAIPEQKQPVPTIDRTEEYQAKGIVGDHDAVIEHVGVGIQIKRGVGDLFIRDDDPTVQKCKERDEENARRKAAGDLRCQHCDEWFTPRKGSGGKKQKYCRPECTRAADAERKAAGANPRQPADQPAGNPVPEPLKNEFALVAPEEGDADGFDWIDNVANVVLPEQAAIAIYENVRGDIVIRQQQSWCDDGDHIVVVRPENLVQLINKLCDIAGVGNAGR